MILLHTDGRRMTAYEFAALPDGAQFDVVYAPNEAHPAGRMARFECVTARSYTARERSYSHLHSRDLTTQEREVYCAQA